jgi:alpha-glucoside transport system substrate-binding protein
VMVMFKDNPAARAFMTYLSGPEAGIPWAKAGGFASPNKNFDASNYPDELTRKTATDFANAKEFVFDMSDLQPGAFGSDAEFTILQDFVKNPDNVDGTAAKLEAAATKAYKSS